MIQGFFFLKNHPVPQSEVDANFALSEKFFHEPVPGPEYKIGAANVGYSGRWCEGYGRDDHISFNFAGRYRAPMNLPPTMAAHYDRLQEFKMTVHTLAVELLRGFAVALNLEEDHFAKWHDLTQDPVCIRGALETPSRADSGYQGDEPPLHVLSREFSP